MQHFKEVTLGGADSGRIERSADSRESRQILFSVLAIICVLIIGTAGFLLIEGWPLLDAFYMTVITLSTVGFGEVHPLSMYGRLFAIALIFLGVGLVAFVLPTLASKLIEQQLVWFFKGKNMQSKVDKLAEHTIFCGYGKLCAITVEQFRNEDANLVIIERSPSKAALARAEGLLVVEGDASLDEVLIAAGIHRAKRLVSLLPKDSENLYVIMTSKELNPKLLLLSRAEDQVGEKRLLRAGASRIFSPYRLAGTKIANGLIRPYVTDFLDLASTGSGQQLTIEELKIPVGSPLVGVALKDSGIRQKGNIIVAAMISPQGEMSVNPSGETILEEESTLIGVGQKSDFEVLGEIVTGGKV